VKSHSEPLTPDSEKQEKPEKARLQKREIKMPDGRYMIFYTEVAASAKEHKD
jgi:hypothetical protein